MMLTLLSDLDCTTRGLQDVSVFYAVCKWQLQWPLTLMLRQNSAHVHEMLAIPKGGYNAGAEQLQAYKLSLH